MPTDPPTPDPADPPPDPPKDPAPGGPPPPSREEVKTWVQEAITEMFAGGGKTLDAPDLSTDKKVEAYVEELVQKAMAEIAKAEKDKGTDPPDPGPDPTPDPETKPEAKTSWQDKMHKWLWGEG